MEDDAPDTHDSEREWSCEQTNQLRFDKSLHTTFFLSMDGEGNAPTSRQKGKLERLRRRHERFGTASYTTWLLKFVYTLRPIDPIGARFGESASSHG